MNVCDQASSGNTARALGRGVAARMHPVLHAHKDCPSYAMRRQYFTGQIGRSLTASNPGRKGAFCCRAEERNSTENKPSVSDSQDDQIKQTLAGLDALLGIDVEEAAKEAELAKKVCRC
jgi:hypothetical protein